MARKHPMTDIAAFAGRPSERTNSRVWEWLKESKVAAVVWTAMRVWLGIMWIQAGWAKLWGAENGAFLHHDGAGVAGFAAHGKAAYTWWGSFLHSFVVPNSGWIGILVAVAEFAIGFALVAGFFTRVAALGSLALLFTYVMSGTASVCAFYALFALVILTMWRTSSWIGLDGLLANYRQRHSDANRHYTPSHRKTDAAVGDTSNGADRPADRPQVVSVP
jgi:thiosulfate dehydrogenase (quinone) large subunit